MYFKKWLLKEVITPEQSQESMRIATYIYKYIKKAADAWVQWRRQNPNITDLKDTFLPFVHKVLQPTVADGNTFLLPSELTSNSLHKVPIYLRITDTNEKSRLTYRQDRGIVTIDVASLLVAKDYRQVSQAVNDLLAKIAHEPVHIYNCPKKTPIYQQQAASTTDSQKKHFQQMLYLTTSHEIEAYGEQFALMYTRNFPKTPYDPQKMQSIINTMIKNKDTGINANANIYLNLMTKPKWQNYEDDEGNYPFKRAVIYMNKVIEDAVERLIT